MSSAPNNQPKKLVDWEAIERDFRTTHYSVRELAELHGVSHAAINKRIKTRQLVRDMREDVIRETRNKLIIQPSKDWGRSPDAAVAVMAAAEVNAQLILSHRRGLERLREVQHGLLESIEAALHLADDPKMRAGLVDDFKKLADVDAKIRSGERQAFGLDDVVQTTANTVEDLLQRLNEEAL